jgi:endogenous inhibitor of DNA gyrase (YacG/DUF329 family)
MALRRRLLGDCPGCGASIPGSRLLARYERGGWPTYAAECPSCGDVVHPV